MTSKTETKNSTAATVEEPAVNPEIEELKKLVADQALAIADLTAKMEPKEDKEVPSNELDFEKPFKKHRQGGGVRLEQNDKIYNIKGVFVEDVKKTRKRK